MWSSLSSDARLFVQRILPISILAIAVICVPVQILQPDGLPRMRGLEQELGAVESENADLSRDIARLRREVRELKDDPAAVEKIARHQLGLVRKNEVVFQLAEKHPPHRKSDTLEP
jgi:cell division protein FtsB